MLSDTTQPIRRFLAPDNSLDLGVADTHWRVIHIREFFTDLLRDLAIRHTLVMQKLDTLNHLLPLWVLVFNKSPTKSLKV